MHPREQFRILGKEWVIQWKGKNKTGDAVMNTNSAPTPLLAQMVKMCNNTAYI